MENIAVNALKYTGIVTLSQYIGKKKTKIAQLNNTGGALLFRFLANCLTGNFAEAKVSYPTKIKLLRCKSTDSGDDYTSVSGFIFWRSAEVRETSSGECRVRYSFMIPRDLLENIDSGSGDLGLGLYSNNASERDPEDFIAFCKLGDGSSVANVLTASLLVDWELVISNNRSTSASSPTASAITK